MFGNILSIIIYLINNMYSKLYYNEISIFLNLFSTIWETWLEDVLLYIERTCIIFAQR